MIFLRLFILFSLLSFSLLGAELHNKNSMPSIVSIKWLQSHYKNPNLVIIDVRKSDIFAQGHLKHAVNMPVFRDLFDLKNNYKMPKLNFLKQLFSRAGIDKDSLIVVYGNDQLIWAARFYWLSQVLGHKEVGLLKRGYGGWKKGELPVTTAIYTPKLKDFIPRVDNTKIETKLDVLVSIGKKVIIDGRGVKFYDGEKSHAKRFGHIPTALNYPGSQNYHTRKDGRSVMKDISQLKKIYKNLPKDKKIILYCEDGADAALNFLVLQTLGYKASVYDGSWLEWGNDDNLPISK